MKILRPSPKIIDEIQCLISGATSSSNGESESLIKTLGSIDFEDVYGPIRERKGSKLPAKAIKDLQKVFFYGRFRSLERISESLGGKLKSPIILAPSKVYNFALVHAATVTEDGSVPLTMVERDGCNVSGHIAIMDEDGLKEMSELMEKEYSLSPLKSAQGILIDGKAIEGVQYFSSKAGPLILDSKVDYCTQQASGIFRPSQLEVHQRIKNLWNKDYDLSQYLEEIQNDKSFRVLVKDFIKTSDATINLTESGFGSKIERALTYPYSPVDEAYCYIPKLLSKKANDEVFNIENLDPKNIFNLLLKIDENNSESLARYLGVEGDLPLSSLHAVFSFGSNRSVFQLHRKFSDCAIDPIINIPYELEGYTLAYSSILAQYGSVPLTLYPSKNKKVKGYLTLLSDANLITMHATEYMSIKYSYVRLKISSPPVISGYPLESVFYYEGREGVLCLRDEVQLCQSLENGMPSPSQEEMQKKIHKYSGILIPFDRHMERMVDDLEYQKEVQQKLGKGMKSTEK